MQIPIIVSHYVLNISTPTHLYPQGILPTLIVLVVHFDLVPGTDASEKYHAAVESMQFQAASGQARSTMDSSTIGGSKRTAISLKTMRETQDEGIELHHDYKGNASNPNYYRNQEAMV